MAVFIAVAAFSLSVLFFGITFDFPHLAADPGGPALYPRIVGAVTAIASVLYVVQQTFLRREKQVAARGDWQARVSEWTSFAAREKTKILSFGLVLILPAAIEMVGFVGATFLFILILMLLSRVTLIRSAITAVLGSVAVYAGYAWVLGAVLPSGYLFE